MMLTAGLATAIVAVLPLVTPPPTPPEESAWDAFCRTLRTFQELFRKEPDFAEYGPPMLQLGLSENMTWAVGGPLLIADGDGKTAVPNPLPPPWFEKEVHGVFACRGRVFPEDSENFVLGLGWSGPMGGALMIYAGLGKRIELETGEVQGIQLRDLTGDGLDEVIVWHDHHPGSGEWTRFVDVYSAVSPPPGVEDLRSPSTLQRVWSGSLWDQFPSHTPRKFEVTFDRNGITVQRQPPKGGSPRRFTWNPECGRFQ